MEGREVRDEAASEWWRGICGHILLSFMIAEQRARNNLSCAGSAWSKL